MSMHNNQESSATPLVVGFVSAVFLTLLAYEITVLHILNGWSLVFWILFLAIAQLVIQLIYFLHLAKDSKSTWKIILLCFMVFVVCILVAGSLWIMNNLNTRMTPQQMDEYMLNQDSL